MTINWGLILHIESKEKMRGLTTTLSKTKVSLKGSMLRFKRSKPTSFGLKLRKKLTQRMTLMRTVGICQRKNLSKMCIQRRM